ncbi:hypothetical protein [Rhizobium cremeum]|uniref:hypothetical protein n=1 Tax=Rhizobium cremeum TaxID=2813827 RepID=UPI0013AFCB9D
MAELLLERPNIGCTGKQSVVQKLGQAFQKGIAGEQLVGNCVKTERWSIDGDSVFAGNAL